MAIAKDEFNHEYMTPKDKLEEKDQFNHQVAEHYFQEHLFSRMGIDIDALTRDGRDVEGTQRFYELTAEGELKDPFADGTELTSDAFLDKMAMGKIIAFPSGEKNPVQMRILGTEPVFSEPLETIPLPEPQEPPKLSGWARFANWITFGRAYQQEKRAIEEYPQKLARWRENDKAFKTVREARTPELLNEELREHQEEVDRRKETARRVAAEQERAKALAQVENMRSEKPVYSIDQYRNTLRECYGATPVFHEKFTFEAGGESYHKAEFDTLQDYGKEARDAGLTEEQFAALSMLTAFDPRFGGKFHPEKYPSATPEENALLATTMYTDTLNAGKVTSRPSHGEVFETIVQPAREETVAALREYRNGQCDRLAQQIARGMHMLSNHHSGKELENELFLSVNTMMADALEVLEKDENLMAKTRDAMKAFAQKDHPEAEPKDVEKRVDRSFALAKGQRIALDLTRKNEKAKALLNGERMGLCKLTPEERKQCIDDRVAFETINEVTAQDLYLQENSEKYKAGDRQKREKIEAAMKAKDQKATNRAAVEYQVFREEAITAPETFVMMGANDQTVSAIVDQSLPNREALYQLSGQELVNALDAKKLFDKNSPYVQKPEKTEPAVQKVVEKAADKSAEIG